MADVLWGIGGMLGLLLIAVALSSDRRAIRVRTVLGALGLQLGLGVLVLYVPPGRWALEKVSAAFQAVIDTSGAGISFLFGPLIPEEGSVFALQVLPVIVFFASLTAVLYHWGILQKVVALLGGALGKVLGTGHAESVNAAANIFVGQTEAPLVIRPYLRGMSRSGLFAVMVGGLSTVAGSVLVGYSLLGVPLEYLIAASFMAAPGALLMAKILVPEDDPQAVARERERVAASAHRRAGQELSLGERLRRMVGGGSGAAAPVEMPVSAASAEGTDPNGGTDAATDPGDEIDVPRHRNVIDAAASGAADGMRLAVTVGAMLLAFISLIALLNLLIGTVGGWFGAGGLTFEQILGWVFSPFMVLIGVPPSEAVAAGSFVGQKIVLNEFVAFANFGPQVEAFSPKTAAVITFALTGFANLSSFGILLGGLGGMAPSRRSEIAELGMRAILGGTLANLMSAAIAGMLIG